MVAMMFISPGAVGTEWVSERAVVNIGGSQQDPNEFCGYLILALTFFVVSAFLSSHYILIVPACIILYAALLTGSRGGLISLVGGAICALVFGLRGFPGKGGDTASMAVEGGVSEPDATEVTPMPTAAAGLEAQGAVTYSGVLDAPGEGTFYVNLTRGNVVFRTGEQASVEVRNVDVSHNVNYGKTVDYGYAFVCDSTDPDTHVTITLPPDAFNRVEVHISTSGAIELGDLQIRQLDAFTASGPIQSGNLRTEYLNAVTAIGNVWLEKVSDGTEYQTQDVCIQAPHGYVAANFSAPRNEWETQITAPDGMVERTASSSKEPTATRSLEVVSASTVNLQYGVS